MVYKICLSGSHYTGKTSLAKSIVGLLGVVGVEAEHIREKSTRAKEMGLPINERTTEEAQLWILHQQFADELRYAQPRANGPNPEVLACDRGPDNYCYLARNLGSNTYALEMVLGHARRFPYDRIYLLPVVDTDIRPGEGIRATEKRFQLDMEREIRDFLKSHFSEQLVELPIPSSDDPHRCGWINLVVNQVLKALGKPERVQTNITLQNGESSKDSSGN